MPGVSDDHITYIGRTAFRTDGRLFGIRVRDRRFHLYTIGKTGTGKSTLLKTMIAQDIARGQGCALFDPHGDLVRDVLKLVPEYRRGDLVYLDATDHEIPWAFNPVAGVAAERRALAAASLVDVFKKLWPDDWGPRLEHLLRNVVWTLLEMPNATLADIPPLLSDKNYRARCVATLENDVVRDFWETEYARYSPAFRAVVIAPLQNKLGALLTDPLLRRIFTGDGTPLDLRSIMDRRQILLVNLDKGRIGAGPATVLGSFLVSHVALAGLARSDQPEASRPDVAVYLDEFQTFSTRALIDMLSELRKFRVSMVLAHQHLAQLDPDVRDAVFGNVGTLIAFRVGAHDAAFVGREFEPTFSAADLIALPRYHVYLRLMIDGEASKPFSAVTVPWPFD